MIQICSAGSNRGLEATYTEHASNTRDKRGNRSKSGLHLDHAILYSVDEGPEECDLESRCAIIRTAGSNPTLSANIWLI